MKFRDLITTGLHFCCPYAFFRVYRNTTVIADRLGCTAGTVRDHKRIFRDHGYKCEQATDCKYRQIPRMVEAAKKLRLNASNELLDLPGRESGSEGSG